MMIFRTPQLGSGELAALAAVGSLRDDLQLYVAEPRRWVGSVRRVLSARAIQGSNSIEGHNVSVEDALAAIEGEDPVDASLVDRQAVEGYRRALTYVFQLSDDDHFSYNAPLLRSLHFMMTEYSLDASPGRWRSGPIWVRNEASGDVVYEAPAPSLIPGLVEELVTDLDEDQTTPAIVRAAMAHLNLVMIHPFRDGNGRMSRCLQTLVLARERILAPELSSIEEYLGRNTSSYYQVLGEVGRGAWHPKGDARSWVRFCLKAHFIQASSVLRRVRESEQIWLEVERLVQGAKLQSRTMAALFEAAIGLRVRNASYRAALRSGWEEGISNQVATLDLRAMVNAGLLQAKGVKRGAYYTASPSLGAVRERIIRGRNPIDTSALFVPSQPTLFGDS